MLLNLRKNKVAFTADIEKAFLQIELNLDDRDATKFLWLSNGNRGEWSPICIGNRMRPSKIKD